MTKATLLLFTFLALVSFSNSHKQPPEKTLLGIWTFASNDDSTTVYKKLEKENYQTSWMQFNPNGHFKIRRNESDCGTPPISYGNYYGNWTLENDTILKVQYAYNRNTIDKAWKVIIATKDSLVLTTNLKL